MGGDELKLVQETFASNWIAPLGPQVDAFEREFCELLARSPRLSDVSSSLLGTARLSDEGHSWLDRDTHSQAPITSNQAPLHAAALSSGTAALHLALRWLNLQPGDEVICSSLTFSASVNPVLYERATPVFVDSDERSWNMDPALLAEAIADALKRGKKPRAVILVHLYGQSADLDPIVALCAWHDIPLIEDAAEALGAVYYGARRTENGGLKTEDRRQTLLAPS